MGLIAEEAKAAGESVPEDVYLTMEINAAVMQRSRTHRVMIVGVPLLQILSERELRGVIAHEFGHYSGGDTRLGPWIYRTRETIGRTIAQLSDDDGDDSWSQRLVRLPFIWYGNAFLRITAAISRRQEFAADASAVRRAGRATYVEALRRVHGHAPVFDSYWMEEVVPVLDTKRRPPVGDGFRHFVGTKAIEEAAEAYLERELRRARPTPTTRTRRCRSGSPPIEGMPDGDPDDSPCSIELLADPAAAEQRVLDDLIGLRRALVQARGLGRGRHRGLRQAGRSGREEVPGRCWTASRSRACPTPSSGSRIRRTRCAGRMTTRRPRCMASPACSATASCSRCTAPGGRWRRRPASRCGRAAATT